MHIETIDQFEARVQSIAHDIVSDAWQRGCGDIHDTIHEHCDGLAEVIYYTQARAVVSALQGTDYLAEAEIAWRECGFEFEDLDKLHVQLAFFAFARAVDALLHSEDRPTIHIVDSARGIYVPQFFAERYGEAIEEEFGKGDLAILLDGPTNLEYDDVWVEILENLEIEDDHGHAWNFTQSEGGVFVQMILS